MKICSYTVVRDDAFYIDMAIKSVLPYVDNLYIQDQMSTDGTTDIIADLARQYPEKIYHDIVDTGDTERFSKTYNEPKWRTLALRKAEELFNPEYILKLDADEVYTDQFFDQVKRQENELQTRQYNSIVPAGARFISKNYLTNCPDEARRGPNGVIILDPHILFWNTKVKVDFVRNPAFPNSFLHCIMHPDPAPSLWLPGICVIHLHRTFGPKAIEFWEEGGEKLTGPPYNPKEQAPKWYNHRVNMATAKKVDFKWPDYVLKKWDEWGTWDD